jgi:hypothetical protein
MGKKLSAFLLITTLCVLLILLSLTKITYASDTGTVTATVTAQNISLSVSSGTVTYGTLALNASKSTITLSDTQTVSNDGNVAEDFNIKGSNSANWTLDSDNSTQDHYIHEFSVNSGSDWTALTTNDQSLAINVAATSGTADFDLQITTPQSSSVYTQQSVNVTVTAIAH